MQNASESDYQQLQMEEDAAESESEKMASLSLTSEQVNNSVVDSIPDSPSTEEFHVGFANGNAKKVKVMQ